MNAPDATPDLGFIHRFVPAATAGAGNAPTLLLLHGTGGDENDLLPVGRALAPTWNLLSPRGPVLENNTTPRFFRRLAEGVFDEADVVRRAGDLAEFVVRAAAHHGFDPGRVGALGYSNGANIAAATLLRHGAAFRTAVLLRAMLPLQPLAHPADLASVSVLISAGRHDRMMPAAEVEKLGGSLERAGARVALRWREADHGLVSEDFADAKTWLAETSP